MTDILLIQPPIRDFYITSKRTVPYGLACIAASLIDGGFSVEIFDSLATSRSRILDLPPEMSYLTEYYGKSDRSPFALFHAFKHYGYSFEHLGKKIRETSAFIVGISSLFTAYSNEAIKIAEIVKRFHPDCKVVLGGHHPTAMPDKIMESKAVDFVLRGEGEVSMPMLARVIKKGEDPEGIPGIVFRSKDGTNKIGAPAIIDDLDAYPLPAVRLLNRSFYKRGTRACAVVVASRGCPLNCTYCSIGSSPFIRYRRRSVEAVVREIEEAIDRYNAGFIDFEDENLSLDKDWFMRFLNEIKKRFSGAGIEFRAMNGLFPPSLDEEVIQAMKEAGFKTLNLSLGSICEDQLRKFRRPDVRNAFERAVICAEKNGLNAVGYVIAGAPGQRAQDSVCDLLYLAGKRILAGVSVFYPVPGSDDFELSEKLGIIPANFALMRSSAIPVSHTTSRREAVTILRLGRILNFMKLLLDRGKAIPVPSPFEPALMKGLTDKQEIGTLLLRWFLHDGKIRGVCPDETVFEHKVSRRLTNQFIEGLKRIEVRGTGSISGFPRL